jgi:methylenetetrahydrofolate dehydrogenase (NADP+)/methenyltetrahydrofolate cyclohydrolase
MRGLRSRSTQLPQLGGWRLPLLRTSTQILQNGRLASQPSPFLFSSPLPDVYTFQSRHYTRFPKEPKILDGREIANDILDDMHHDLKLMAKELPQFKPPHLVMMCVAPHKPIKSFMRMKERACHRAGFTSEILAFGMKTTEEEFIANIKLTCQLAHVDGVIVQLPLPAHINEYKALQAVDPTKDVDGLHALNVGNTVLGRGSDGFMPCTPLGIVELLERGGVSLEGKQVVIIGRSNLVGKPLANLLISKRPSSPLLGPTVSIIHSGTPYPPLYTSQADIIIAAAGRPKLVQPEDVKLGVGIVDVGISYIPDPATASGYSMSGDVDPRVYAKCSFYTPVPGGVGPMTVAMLLRNTFRAALRYRYAQQYPEAFRAATTTAATASLNRVYNKLIAKEKGHEGGGGGGFESGAEDLLQLHKIEEVVASPSTAMRQSVERGEKGLSAPPHW